MATVQLEKVDDRINRELSEDLSGKQEIEAEKSNEASMKLKSTSNDEASLSFHDLENTQNTSGETATSSAQDKLSSTSKTEQRNPLPLHLKKVAILTAPMVRVRTMQMEMGPFRMMIMQTMMKMMMKIMKIYLSGHNHQKNV